MAALFALLVAATPASAGGSWFDTSETEYKPGDAVKMVGYTTGGQLGWIEDAPFYGYLRVVHPDPANIERWPAIYPTDLPLGPLQLEKAGPGDKALRATITFDLPRDLAPGAYDFVYCNDPCTTGLGDLVGGTVYVGVSPPRAESALPSSTIARTSTSVSATTVATVDKLDPPTTSTQQKDRTTDRDRPTRSSGDHASWTLGGLALAAASVAGFLLSRRRRRSTESA